MNACDFEACAYDGAIYCNGCLPNGLTPDSDEVTPVFASDEMDSYPTCDACGAEHDYVSLTSEGARWKQRRHWSRRISELANRCGGNLPAFSSPGCYPYVYLENGSAPVCPKCANDVDRQLALTTLEIHWEGAPLVCEECGDDIESAYGEPNAAE